MNKLNSKETERCPQAGSWPAVTVGTSLQVAGNWHPAAEKPDMGPETVSQRRTVTPGPPCGQAWLLRALGPQSCAPPCQAHRMPSPWRRHGTPEPAPLHAACHGALQEGPCGVVIGAPAQSPWPGQAVPHHALALCRVFRDRDLSLRSPQDPRPRDPRHSAVTALGTFVPGKVERVWVSRFPSL